MRPRLTSKPKLDYPVLIYAAGVALTFSIFAVPVNIGVVSSNFMASTLTLGLAVWLAIVARRHFMEVGSMLWIMAAMALLGSMNALATSDSVLDFLTTIRYTVVTPVTFFVVGYYLCRRSESAAIIALIPGAICSIVIMYLAFQSPFVGEISAGNYVGERSRFYIHPISHEIIFPVAIAESCAAGFALLWYMILERRWTRWLLFTPVVLGAVGLSVAGATRTYLYAIVIVLGFVLLRLVSQRRLFQPLLLGAGVTVLVIVILSVDEFRELVMVRLDRFVGGGELDNSERLAIWHDRLQRAFDSGPVSGISMDQYWDRFAISSHNILIDFFIIGGWFFGILMIGCLAYLALLCLRTFARRRTSDSQVAHAAAVLMMLIVVQVSSPIISSLSAYATLWYLAGCFMGGLAPPIGQSQQSRTRLPRQESIQAKQISTNPRPWLQSLKTN